MSELYGDGDEMAVSRARSTGDARSAETRKPHSDEPVTDAPYTVIDRKEPPSDWKEPPTDEPDAKPADADLANRSADSASDRNHPAAPGLDRPLVEPERYVVHPADTTALEDRVRRVGRDNPEKWIDAVNPHFNSGQPGFQTNCGECSRAFATTAQTDRSVAAAGDPVKNGESQEMWEWTGVNPAHALREGDLTKLDDFQQTAWDHVADTLAGKPPGTVVIIGVDWEPEKIDGLLIPQGGHWFNAHVSTTGLKWVDAQEGTYRDWPPKYLSNVANIEFVYRLPGETRWRHQ